MTTFLIQTIKGQIKHDFGFHLRESIEFQNWFYNQKTYQAILSDKIKDVECIPVGSLEFVFQYMEECLNIKTNQISPINVPKEMQTPTFLKREYEIKDKNDIKLEKPTFIKSATKYKNFMEITDNKEIIPEGKYIVSEVVDIESEWRTFVYHNEIKGLQCYSGDFTLFPDITLIKNMINEYKDAPPSYTLDIGVNKYGTFVIEVHPFVSCGLYGFCDYKYLPIMFIEGFRFLIK